MGSPSRSVEARLGAFEAPQRRRNPRHPGFDYTLPGSYFVTICVKDFRCMLGVVGETGEFVSNPLGDIVAAWWDRIPERFSSVQLDAFVVMPNHVHGIVVLTETEDSKPPALGAVIAWFKYQTTVQVNSLRGTPGQRLWHRNYYDHVVRNEPSLDRIREYIFNNPRTWRFDMFNRDAGS